MFGYLTGCRKGEQRALKWTDIEYQGDTKYKFYKKTGLSNGFLDKNRNIGSDKCEIISVYYPNLSLEWLITGKGDMEKPNMQKLMVLLMLTKILKLITQQNIKLVQ